ncbi:MAG TPA: hypothetical protein VN962_18375 [Polyangia bacterium]|nr:hypothetical protein [Polyangia bacterium]
MLALAFTFAATALAGAPSASVTCADGPASCDSAWAAPFAFAADRGDDEAPAEYATPAEVDCPEPPQPPALTPSGECSEAPAVALNFFRYRVSRYPESELPAGRLAPMSGSRRAHAAPTLTRGAPDAAPMTRLTLQPMALTALPALFPAAARRLEDTRAQALPARALAPPDRPPRV